MSITNSTDYELIAELIKAFFNWTLMIVLFIGAINFIIFVFKLMFGTKKYA